MGSRGPHLGVEQGTYSRQYKYRTGHHNANVCSVTSTVKKAQQPGHHQGGPVVLVPVLSLHLLLGTSTTGRWPGSSSPRWPPTCSAPRATRSSSTLTGAGIDIVDIHRYFDIKEVKLDIDRCGDSVDIVDISRYLDIKVVKLDILAGGDL